MWALFKEFLFIGFIFWSVYWYLYHDWLGVLRLLKELLILCMISGEDVKGFMALMMKEGQRIQTPIAKPLLMR